MKDNYPDTEPMQFKQDKLAAPPQPASAGALSAREWLIEWDGKHMLHPSQDACVESLAAHDQKVRADALQEAIGLARLTPFRAHAADDIDFHSGCEQTRERIVDALRKLAAPAASKPEASKGEK